MDRTRSRSNIERRPRAVFSRGDEPDPRFTLANERTLLAWLRTALAFVVTGIATLTLREIGRGEAALFMQFVATSACGAGGLTALGAHARWRRLELALRLGQPLPAPRLALLGLGTIVGLAIGSTAVLLGFL